MMSRAVSVVLLLLFAVGHARAEEKPAILREVGFDQRLNEQVPLDLVFQNESGESVALGKYFGSKPVILVLAYYRCPMLCTLVLNGVAESLRGLPLRLGVDFDVVTVSFDARETPELARAKKQSYVESVAGLGQPRAEEGWHFLTGDQQAIDRLTKATGFRYAYDSKLDQFAHASGIMVLTPQGRIARYFFGVDFPVRHVRLGLVEASDNKIGSPIDQVWLLCYHYDPVTGKYTATVMNIVRLAGAVTILSFVVFFVVLRRKALRKQMAKAI